MLEIIEIMLNALRTLEILFLCCTLSCFCIGSVVFIVQEVTNFKDWLKYKKTFSCWLSQKEEEELEENE